MQKMSLKSIMMTICISYTMISVGVHLYELLTGSGDFGHHLNVMMMFFCTAIAVVCLSLYSILEDWSSLLIIIVQYVLATVIIMVTTYIIGRFVTIAPGGYFDMWRSFTIIYAVGALWYYIDIWLYVKKQNKWLEQAKKQRIETENAKESDLEQ